jgi:hypothetical protein
VSALQLDGAGTTPFATTPPYLSGHPVGQPVPEVRFDPGQLRALACGPDDPTTAAGSSAAAAARSPSPWSSD